MFASDTKRLEAARQILTLIAEQAKADVSAELWDGSVVPLGPNARMDVRLQIRSSVAFRRLLLSPNVMTIFELYATGELDIAGARPLEAADLWDHNTLLGLGKTLDRKKLAALAWPFLLPGGKGKPDRIAAEKTFDGAVATTPTRGRDDKSMISFHYDASNDFYALFLDPEMVYSTAYFDTPDMSLEAAQVAKLDHICRKLRLSPGNRMLDIGCGWGGLIAHAVTRYGVTVHGVTLSEQQLAFCRAKVERLGIADKVVLELRDYRHIEGRAKYDRISQIEMFEHVGLDNHDAHFETVHRLLRPRGTHLHQASVRRATRNLADFRKETGYMKFLRRYIFPGGDLDYIGMTATNLERLGFEVHDIENMREHATLTLRHWEKRLAERAVEAERLVGAQRTRLWQLYFALAAKGFERGGISVFQTVATRRYGGASGLGLQRP